MGTTGVDVPGPLVRAFLQQLASDGPPLERRRFLRRVAESAVGPLPGPPVPGDALPGEVAVTDGVALAVAVLEPFDGPPPVTAEPVGRAAAADPSLRVAARELARRARGRVLARVPARLAARVGRR